MTCNSIHERALRAASHITGLSMVVMGCVPKGDPGPRPAAAVQTVQPGVVDVDPGPVVSEDRTQESADPIEACIAQTDAAFDEQGKLRAGQDSESVQGCCQKIAEAIDAAREVRHASPETAAEAPPQWNRFACCSLLEWRGSIACTPWGPTAPPAAAQEIVAEAFPGVLDLRAAAREVARALELAQPGDSSTQRAAIATWRGRMVNEYVSARVFETVAVQLRAAGFCPKIVQEWAGFADEERRHGVLCGAVVEALGGSALARRPALPDVPHHPDTDRRTAVLRNVLSISALSETVAVALIGAERLEMPRGSDLHGLLTAIYADEVGHAHAGWRLLRRELATDDGTLAADLHRYLPTALRDLVRHELDHLPPAFVAPPDGYRWGLCDGAKARSLFADTLDRVIAPALEHLLGLPAEPLEVRH